MASPNTNISEISAKPRRKKCPNGCPCRRHRTDARKHGRCKTVEYSTWNIMKQRCYNANSKTYPRYGGRGIRVCQRWRDSFVEFLADMGERPSNGHSIDRIDNTLHYSCGKCEECLENGWLFNCRWLELIPQANNRRNNNWITHQGRTQTLAQWCRELNLDYSLVGHRFRRCHWSIERALSTPTNKGFTTTS